MNSQLQTQDTGRMSSTGDSGRVYSFDQIEVERHEACVICGPLPPVRLVFSRSEQDKNEVIEIMLGQADAAELARALMSVTTADATVKEPDCPPNISESSPASNGPTSF